MNSLLLLFFTNNSLSEIIVNSATLRIQTISSVFNVLIIIETKNVALECIQKHSNMPLVFHKTNKLFC